MPQKENIAFKIRLFRILKAIAKSKKFLVFLVFVVVSSVLWFLNTIEKEYITPIRFKVKFENVPYNGVPINELPDEIDVSVRGFGYNLLKYKLAFNQVPIVIDFKEYKLSRYPIDKNIYYFPTARLVDYLMKRFDNDVFFVSVKPDTLFFSMNKAEKKKVPVKADISYTIDGQYKIAGSIKLKPDSVVISGNPAVLAQIDSVVTEPIRLNMISASLQKKIPVQKIDKLKIEPSSITITIPVEKCSEKTISILVRPLNFPDSVKVLFIPERVDVSFKVSLDNYDKISEKDFVISADYKEGKMGVIPLAIERKPESISDERINKQEVHYIIEKK